MISVLLPIRAVSLLLCNLSFSPCSTNIDVEILVDSPRFDTLAVFSANQKQPIQIYRQYFNQLLKPLPVAGPYPNLLLHMCILQATLLSFSAAILDSVTFWHLSEMCLRHEDDGNGHCDDSFGTDYNDHDDEDDQFHYRLQ